jgi:acetyltransferase-like isoleucine patch superfamily enzyme
MIWLRLFSLILPWPLRRWLLRKAFGYQIDSSARIGVSWIFPKHLTMNAGSHIDHLTVCKGLDSLVMGAHASIGRLNWITGFPSGPSRHFAHQRNRKPELHLGDHAAITNRHLIDCTNRVSIGAFTTLAGFNSQVLTHSIDISEGRQSSEPVEIGAYCFIGTNAVILGGASLPDYCVLGARSLLNKSFERTHQLYAGVPAKEIKEMRSSARYFNRQQGYVV